MRFGKFKISLDNDYLVINIFEVKSIKVSIFQINFKSKTLKKVSSWNDCYIDENFFTICISQHNGSICFDSDDTLAGDNKLRRLFRFYPLEKHINNEIRLDISQFKSTTGEKLESEFIYKRIIESFSILSSIPGLF